MSIEISGSGSRPQVEGNNASQVNGNGKQSQADKPANRNSSDTLSLTDKASQLQALESQISNLPVVDTQRVLEVQHSLATGTYQIEPAQVADKLLSFEAGLANQ